MNLALKNFGRHLKKNGLRLTVERQKLLGLILTMKGHFGSEDVLKKSEGKNLSVSRATIYRILPVLVEAKIIQQSLLTSEGQSLFEVTWKKAHHDHLICISCKKVIEFQDNAIEVFQREIANKYGFILERHVMELVGRCRECRMV
jgi:Fur family transcriptional regulator, ferric uptake regulator